MFCVSCCHVKPQRKFGIMFVFFQFALYKKYKTTNKQNTHYNFEFNFFIKIIHFVALFK